MMLPRVNYLTYCLEKVKSYFDDFVSADFTDESFSELWFEFNGKPLRWDLPIGVQFDTIVGLGGHTQ